MKNEKPRRRLLPDYAWLPVIICVVMNILCFQGTRLITKNFHHYDISLPIDDMIPFLPQFVVVYLGCYVTWLLSYWFIAREEREICYRFFGAEITAKVVCTAIFLLFPTSMARPEITGSDIFSQMMGFVYSMDTPDNLFPSLHCFASWMAWRGLLPCKNVPKWYRVTAFIFMVLVLGSVVFTKQHLFVDIIGGILIAELGWLISNATGAWKLFRLQRSDRRLCDNN